MKQKGFIVPVIIIFTLAIVAIGTATLTLISSNYNIAQRENYRVHAQLAADAGGDAAIQELNANAAWTGTSSETTIANQNGIKTTYSASVATDPSDSFKKTITVTGRAYSPSTSLNPRSERKYEVSMRGVGGGSYAVVTGVGGLNMRNSSKIVGGDVFVNGKITMENTAQIGLTTKPVNVSAAHQSCPQPPNASFPQVCGSGNGQPISLGANSRIYGEVNATNQTNGSGMSLPGLVPNSTVAPLPLPSHDRAAQKAAVASTVTAASASCSSGTKTWSANLKIIGDVTVSNTCKVTVLGNVWITGTLRISNASKLIVATGVSAPPEIMVDGVTSVPGITGVEVANASTLESNNNATPVGFRVVTYRSDASCSPECTSVTGTALASSQTDTTIRLGNGSSGPNTEFYARWTQVELANAGNVGAVVGQTVNLTNSSAITFGTPVSGASGASAWVVSSYRRLY